MALVAGACNADQSVYRSGWDASSNSDAAYHYAADITLVAPTPEITPELVPGEVLTVTVRIADDFDYPVAGERIAFALLGQSMDSSLSALYATTDADGFARIYLRAGQTPTSFQVRVSLSSSTSYIPVTVKATLLVDLAVSVDPSVAQYVENVSVKAYAARTCAEIEGVPPSATLNISSGVATADLTGLSSGTSYAVVAKATDSTGTYSYSSCVEIEDPSLTTDFLISFELAQNPTTE
jgi:hypothetical protein